MYAKANYVRYCIYVPTHTISATNLCNIKLVVTRKSFFSVLVTAYILTKRNVKNRWLLYTIVCVRVYHECVFVDMSVHGINSF